MGKRELVALLNLSTWCLVMVGRLFLAVPQGCLRFVIVVFPDHTQVFLIFQVLWQITLAWSFVALFYILILWVYVQRAVYPSVMRAVVFSMNCHEFMNSINPNLLFSNFVGSLN